MKLLSNTTVTIALLAFLRGAGYVHAAEENMSSMLRVKSPDDLERELPVASGPPAVPAPPTPRTCSWVYHSGYWYCESSGGSLICTNPTGGAAITGCRAGGKIGKVEATGIRYFFPPTTPCKCVVIAPAPPTTPGAPKSTATSAIGAP